MLVTRVASEEADTPLGEELARQLFGVPKALRVACVFVLRPRRWSRGSRRIPFLVIGVTCSSARPRGRGGKTREERARSRSPREAAAPRSRTGSERFVPLVVPWRSR